MKKTYSLVAASLLSFATTSAFAYDDTKPSTPSIEKPSNVLEAARANGGFTIFLSAIEEAEMTKPLSSNRLQYTLYAPTDAAFAKMPKEQLDALLQDKDELRRIIAQHVVLGKYSSSDISVGTMTTIWGQKLPVTTHRNLHVNWVKVVATDIESKNGIVHAIDNVIVSSGESDTNFSQQLASFNSESIGQGNRF